MEENLYHYTDLNSLKLILRNKTFRLSSLSKMDDLEEGETTDFDKLGRFIYISSWTENSIDDLGFWNYSKSNDGVRIRMKKNPFKTEKINREIVMHGMKIEINDNFNLGLLDIMKNKNVVFAPPIAVLHRVTYTDNERFLRPLVYKEFPGNHFSLVTENLGIFKRVEWQVQQEWRYRLNSMPINTSEFDIFSEENGKKKLLDKIRKRQDLGFIDLPLKEDAFENIEIMIGPYMSQNSINELDEIIKESIPDAIVKRSKLSVGIQNNKE